MDMDADDLGRVRSREALRFEFVDEQGWDASCGYAALATLLGRFRGLEVDERTLLDRSVGTAGGETVLKVSLAELVRLARDAGMEVRPWRAPFGHLAGLLARSSPLLVHYDRPQGHFALVLAAGPDGVVTADPARGLELLTRGQFLDRWSGVVLEVMDLRNPSQGRDLVEKTVRTVRGRANTVQRALSHPPSMQ